MLVAIALNGCGRWALGLLRARPPFDPGEATLTLHGVFLLTDEVPAPFAAAEDVEGGASTEQAFWHAVANWARADDG